MLLQLPPRYIYFLLRFINSEIYIVFIHVTKVSLADGILFYLQFKRIGILHVSITNIKKMSFDLKDTSRGCLKYSLLYSVHLFVMYTCMKIK